MNHKLFVLLLTLVPLLATAEASDPNQDAKEAQIIKTIEDLRAQRGVEFNYHRESKVGDTTRVEEYLGANEAAIAGSSSVKIKSAEQRAT